MTMNETAPVAWRAAEVLSPHLPRPVPVVAAEGLPYRPDANRLQTVNLYLPETPETAALVGTPVTALPGAGAVSSLPRIHVHIHGGAWRDPQLLASSVEAAVAHAFGDPDGRLPVAAVASIDYTLTHFPTHPTLPYDAATAGHADPAREATHPRHVSDVLHALALLRSLGLRDGSYVLSGHSAGACLAFQAVFGGPAAYGLAGIDDAPRPAAMFGLNGLYDLPALVDGLGASHEHLRGIYETLLTNAFGPDRDRWPAASPARLDPAHVAARVRDGRAPTLVLLDQSAEDQLVPMNQRDRLAAVLARIEGVRVVEGHRCMGTHAAPWEQGVMIRDSLRDVLDILGEAGTGP